jgi:starvation-inducible DNA-binding protein
MNDADEPIGEVVRPHRAPTVTSSRYATVSVPTLSSQVGVELAATLQTRLVCLIDLALTLKHIHWNVVGPHFMSVHNMLDAQHAGVQVMADELAERVATLGGVPCGLPGRVVSERTWNDYGLERADAIAHLGALDFVYQGVIEDQRAAIETTLGLDVVSEDLLIRHSGALERYHWLVRSHLADWAGGMANAGADSELSAARAVAVKSSRNASRIGDKPGLRR